MENYYNQKFIVLFCRVLKPPGGGSSDLFGGSIPSTPRSARNHMASNIFAAPETKPVNGMYSLVHYYTLIC